MQELGFVQTVDTMKNVPTVILHLHIILRQISVSSVISAIILHLFLLSALIVMDQKSIQYEYEFSKLKKTSIKFFEKIQKYFESIAIQKKKLKSSIEK